MATKRLPTSRVFDACTLIFSNSHGGKRSAAEGGALSALGGAMGNGKFTNNSDFSMRSTSLHSVFADKVRVECSNAFW